MVGMSGPMFNPKPAGVEVSTVDNFHAFWALCLNFAIFCQGVRFFPNMDPDVVQAAISLDHDPLECLPQGNLEPPPDSSGFPKGSRILRVWYGSWFTTYQHPPLPDKWHTCGQSSVCYSLVNIQFSLVLIQHSLLDNALFTYPLIDDFTTIGEFQLFW